MNVFSEVLPNGLPVIGINTETFGSVTLLVMVKVGSRYEDSKTAGISHFLEHVVSKAIPSYPSSFQLAEAIEGVGGVSNAFTSREYTGYWIKLPVKHFAKASKILCETVTKPLLNEDELEREKGVVIEEINMYEDEPQHMVGQFYEDQLYPNNSLGKDIAGTKKTVQSFTRGVAVSWLKKHYHANNAIVAVAGNLGSKQAFKEYVQILRQDFSVWEKGTYDKPQEVNEQQTKPILKVHFKKTQQSHLIYGYRAFSFFDDRRYILSVLARLLGGGMSSRLFNEVREKRGLCYYIYTSKDQYSDVGHISTQAGVNTDVKKITQAITVIHQEHQKIASGEVSAAEVSRVKEMIKGHILLSLEDSYSVANFFAGEQLLSGKAQTPEEVISHIDAVTRDEVVALAHELFVSRGLNITVLGPLTEKDLDLGKILG